MIYLLGAATALAAGSPTLAGDDEDPGKNDYKWYFFHKAGVAEEAFIEDYGFCSEYGARVDAPRGPNVYTPNAIAAGAAGFLAGMQRSNQRRQMFRAVMRKCMAMKGYDRFGISEAEMEALWDGGWDEAQTRVAARAAAPISSERRAAP